MKYVDPDGRKNLYYYIKITGQKNRNGGYNFFSFSITYSSNRSELQKYRNKEYSQLSFEKKLNKSAPVFTESDEFIDDHKGQTNPMTEAVVLSDIYEDDLTLDSQDGNTSVKTTARFEIPYDGSPEVTLKNINEYLIKIKNEETQTEDPNND